MDVEFIVRLRELKRAFRRLSVRLPDESEAGGEFVLFNVGESTLEILAQGSAEGLTAAVVHPGGNRTTSRFSWHCQGPALLSRDQRSIYLLA